MINLKIIRDAGFAGRAAPADAGPAGPSRGKGKGGGIGGGKPGEPAPSLKTDLYAYYDMNTDPSTVIADSHTGGRDMTTVGTLASATVGGFDCCNFGTYSGYGEITPVSSTSWDTTGDFTWAGWGRATYFPGGGAYANMVSFPLRSGLTGSQRDFVMGVYGYSGSPGWQSWIYDTAGAAKGTGFDAATYSAGLNTWNFLAYVHDSVANEFTMYFNAETPQTGTTGANNMGSARDAVRIGRIHNSAAYQWMWRGYMMKMGFWTVKLAADDVTWLYNSGSGRLYSELA